MRSILYVSRREQGAGTAHDCTHDIVVAAKVKNAGLDVTGALVATPTHFAQVLEGPETSLQMLMASIQRDPRHSDMAMAPMAIQPRREFTRWSLAYCGESSYVSGLVDVEIGGNAFDAERNAAALRSLMLMLS